MTDFLAYEESHTKCSRVYVLKIVLEVASLCTRTGFGSESWVVLVALVMDGSQVYAERLSRAE